MGAREYNYDEDQSRDYSDLSDQNQESLRSKKIDGVNYDPNSLESLENSSAQSSRASDGDIASNETSPWRNEVKGSEAGGTHRTRYRLNRKNPGAKPAKLKGKMPRAAKYVGILTAGGSVAAVGLFSTFIVGLAPIHITEIITEKLNSAASTMEARMPLILSSKLKKNAGDTCSRIKASCRFTSISDKQLDKLKKSGFNIETDVDADTGKTRIKKMSIDVDGKTVDIDENNLHQILLSNPKINSSMKKAYSGKFASFLDSVASKFMSKLGISKAPVDNEGKTESELNEEMTSKANAVGDDVDLKTDDKQEESDSDSDEARSNKKAHNNNVDKNQDIINSLESDAGDLSTQTDLNTKASAIQSKLSGVGLLELPCTLYSIGNMLNIGVKTIRAVTLAQFSMDFLSFSSKIKSGQATPEEFSMIGSKMMATTASWGDKSSSEESTSKLENAISYFANTAASTNTKSFTDSQGWRALAYNDKLGSLDDSAYKFTLGVTGPLFQFFSKIRNFVNKVTGNNANTACKIINHDAMDWVEAAIKIVGGGFIGPITDLALEAIIGTVLGKALEGVPNLLAGKIVTEKTQGEDYGNAIISGAGSLMSKNTISGGGSPLTKSEAVAFYLQNEDRIAKEGAYERSTRSPFDVTTRHTFLGSIVSSILPYSQSLASVGGFVPAILSVVSNSFASILPGASAVDAANFEANMSLCEDEDIKSLNIATDPFCNPYTGISTSTLNKSTEEVIEYLANKGEIDTTTEDPISAITPNSKLKSYLANCMNRENPIGVGEDPNAMGLECSSAANPDVAYYAAYLTDVRIQDGMDNGVQPGGGQSQNSTSSYAGSAKNKDCKAGDLCWPIEGANSGMISSGRWFQGSHNGYDFGAGGVTFGTPVYNVADGEVIAVGNKSIPNTSPSNFGYGPNVLGGYPAYCDGNGNFNTAALGGGGGEHIVFIKHTVNGKVFYSSYMHMQKNSDLTPGQKISAGQQIGEVGNYGCSSGAHLHFSIQNSLTGDHVDPKTYLGELK